MQKMKNEDEKVADDKLTDLNTTLTSVENELLQRTVERQNDTIDDFAEIVNTLADDGDIELTDCCGGHESDADAGGEANDGEEPKVPEGSEEDPAGDASSGESED